LRLSTKESGSLFDLLAAPLFYVVEKSVPHFMSRTSKVFLTTTMHAYTIKEHDLILNVISKIVMAIFNSNA